MFRNIVTNKLFIPLLLITITFITYINILPNQLFFDDEELIYKNTYIQNLSFFPKYFTENMIAGAGKSSSMYRPILTLSFALDYFVWKSNPMGFHLTSMFLHTANSILVFFLIFNLFKSKLVSFLTSVFFIIHPAQTETVSYISGRTDLLSTFFALLSISFFISLIKKGSLKSFQYLVSIIFFIFSLLSKETSVILPLLLILITIIGQNIDKRKFLLALTPFLLLDIFYIYIRLTFLNFTGVFNLYTSDLGFTIDEIIYSKNLFVRLLTFTKIFFDYIGILFFPKDLIIARNTSIILSPVNLWFFSFIFAVFMLSLITIKTFKKNKIYFFSLLWFFITILPVSGFIPINNTIAEHYLYFPSLSFFLIISFFISLILNKSVTFSIKTIEILSIILIIIILVLRTILRNLDWRDPITFYTKSLQQSPWHIPMRNNLAIAYADKGQFELAINEYQQIIALGDSYPNVHHNLANVYNALGKYKQAEEEYKKALSKDAKFIFSYYGLIDLYNKMGEKNKLSETERKLKQIEKK